MSPLFERLGWVLLHFAWQETTIAIAAMLAFRALRHSSSRVRYAAGWISLVAMLVVPLVTAQVLAVHRPMPMASDRLEVRLDVQPGIEPLFPEMVRKELPPADRGKSLPAVQLPLALAWLAGVGIFLLRLAGGMVRVARVHRQARQLPESAWAIVSAQVAARLDVRRSIRVVDADFVDSPTLIGWSSPIIVLPAAAIAKLAPAQVEAILAHELAHVRRRDYAVNVLQVVAEALLFFHPGAWIVSWRIRREREHCCDDLAVAVCDDRVGYAAALAELETSRGSQPRLALAVTGGSLLARVRHVLAPAPDDRRLVNIGVIGALMLVLVTAAGATEYHAAHGKLAGITVTPVRRVVIRSTLLERRGAAAQDPSSPATFDVASVKRNRSGDSRGGIQIRDGRLVATNVPLRELIRSAYQLQDFQIAGDPSWTASERFDVTATGTAGGDAQARLRALLADRFRLVTRMDTREMPIYELVTAREDRRLGDKLRVTDADCEWDGARCGFRRTPFSVAGVARTMTQFAAVLSTLTGRMVTDRTGLASAYDMDLLFTPDNGGQPVFLNGTAVDYPTIFTALQEQLGLKLQPARGQVPVLIVEKVDAPAPD